MVDSSEPQTYTATAKFLHWLIALAVFGQISLGLWMIGIPKSPPGVRVWWFNLHKSIGITLGLIILVRLLWRLTHRAPPLPGTVPAWQRIAAKVNHVLLYVCMIVMPLSGYLGSSFTKFPIVYWGNKLPNWGWESPALKDLMSQIHLVTVIIFITLIAIHVAAALKHLLVTRDGVFQRMWPSRGGGMSKRIHGMTAHGIGSALLIAGCLAAAPAWAAMAMVGNENGGTITLIDTDKDEVIGEIKTGGKPRGTAIDQGRKVAYVSEQAGNSLLVIDLVKRAVIKKIDLGESPEGVYISPDGRWVTASVELTNSVVFIDTAKDEIGWRINIKGENPEHAVFSPDSRIVYASAEEDDKLEVIDVAGRKLVTQLTVGTRPRGIAFTLDGAKAYVACERADMVYVIDAKAHKILRTIKAGLRSNGLTLHPDGKRLYLSNGGDHNVMVIDTDKDVVTATIPVGQRPWNMGITKDGGKLYVANGRSDSVSVIDTAKNAVVKTIPVGKTPWGVHILD